MASTTAVPQMRERKTGGRSRSPAPRSSPRADEGPSTSTQAPVARAMDRVASSGPVTFWDALPYAWRYTLGSDVLYWAVLGGIMLFNPRYALELQGKLAHRFGWAAPSTAMASNTLLMYVQSLGAVLFSLMVPAGYGAYTGDKNFARAYAGMRMVLSLCLAFILITHSPVVEESAVGSAMGLGSKTGPTGSTYKVIMPFLAHSVWHAGAVLASGPEFWSKLLGRTPRHLA